MKRILTIHGLVVLACLLLLFFPAIVMAQAGQMTSNVPPVASPIVREGDFALSLEQTLGLGTSGDEVTAESHLGELGIGPNNGWIADYPVTPDIVGEVQDSVVRAADSGKLSISRDEALNRLDSMKAQVGLPVRPYAAGGTYAAPPATENYPNPSVVNNYYTTEGPPIVTYYTPPPDYYYLYTWVPYPFFVTGFFFDGFFVLNDFHRHHFVHGRSVFVTNHFRDVRDNRVFRVDPVHRFQGRTFAGIGASHNRAFVSTGVPRSDRRVFNARPSGMPPGAMARSFHGGSFRGGMMSHGGGFHGGMASHGGGFHGRG